jgi:hypothetical protein
MKPQFSLLAALLLVASAAHARDAEQDKQEILRVEAALCRAFETGDAAMLRASIDPTFTFVDSHGAITDLAKTAAEVESREPSYEEFRNHDQTVRLYGDAAVVTGITSVRGQSGADKFQADFTYTDTWIRRDGRWVMVATHASRLPKPE